MLKIVMLPLLVAGLLAVPLFLTFLLLGFVVKVVLLPFRLLGMVLGLALGAVGLVFGLLAGALALALSALLLVGLFVMLPLLPLAALALVVWGIARATRPRVEIVRPAA
jgi:hypothetical protein